MPHITLTDAQIDARANGYARAHHVSYSEALTHVVAFTEAQSSDTAAATNRSTQKAAALTDAEADAQARRYAAQHGMDYLTALGLVMQDHGMAQAASNGAAQQNNHASQSDRDIDTKARAYARTHGVNYSEALTHVANFAANFSEAPTAGVQAAQALESQQIEIFRAGQHIDDAGVAHLFSEADLAGMAASYNPALREAPLTVGHPKDNLPAYGWVKAVARTAAGALAITPYQVEPQFAEMVQAGRFKKRSASFYPPRAPNNPTPGKWYLRHVAFLGAQQPAIHGLADVSFKTAAGDGAVCFGWS